MRKAIKTLFLCCIFTQSFGQTQKRISTYLLAQYNHTIKDYTIGNNPWGIGFGLQAFLNTNTKLRPTIELTGDLYLEDDKVLRSNPDGSFSQNGNSVDGMINLFVGSSFPVSQNVYLSFTGGPSFISGQTFLGIKPSIGFFNSNHQNCIGKISYINIFNRTQATKEDFSSLSVAIGLRLF